MRSSMTLLAALGLSAAPLAAQPPKHAAVPKVSEAPPKAPVVVLASADEGHAGAPATAQSSAEPKRPAPRVTHCRCGDPVPGDETPEQ